MANNVGANNVSNRKQPKRSTQVKQKQTSKQQIINQLRDNKEIKYIIQNNTNLYNKISTMFKDNGYMKFNIGELHVYLDFQKNNGQNNKDFNEVYNLFNLIKSSVDRKSIDIYNQIEVYKIMNAIRMEILTIEQYIDKMASSANGKTPLEGYYNTCKAIFAIASQHKKYTIDKRCPNKLGEITIDTLCNFLHRTKYGSKKNKNICEDENIKCAYNYIYSCCHDNRRYVQIDKNITINEFITPAKQAGRLTEQELQQLQELQGKWRNKTPEEIELYKKQYAQQQSQRYTQALCVLSNDNILFKIGNQLENIGQPEEARVSHNTGHY